MSDRIETFEVGDSVRVIAGTRSGDITVVIGSPGSVRVVLDGPGASNYEIDHLGDVISIEPRRKGRFIGSSVDLVLTVPETSSLDHPSSQFLNSRILATRNPDTRLRSKLVSIRSLSRRSS